MAHGQRNFHPHETGGYLESLVLEMGLVKEGVVSKPLTVSSRAKRIWEYSHFTIVSK